LDVEQFSVSLYKLFKTSRIEIIKKPRINNQITAPELRVIGNDGGNLGVLTTSEAIKVAREQELDLIEISPATNPPIAKIMDLGKYLYQQKKKQKESAKNAKEVELKSIQIGIGTSSHDLEMKAKRIDDFLKDGNRVRVEMRLKGRTKYLEKGFLEERLSRILHLISEKHKVADGPKKSPRGIMAIIEKTS